MGDFGASIWGPAAIGAIGGLFGGGEQYPDWYQQEQQYWMRRKRDQEAQATGDYSGTRGAYASGIEDIMNSPGYEDWEAEGLYYTPEEAQQLQVSPQEEAGILSLASAPITGAMKRAEDALQRAAGARGNYAPGLTAGVQRIQQEGGRQAAEANLAARLGITNMRRQGARDVAQTRIGATRDIGQTRLQGRALGVGMRGQLAGADLQRQLQYNFTPQAPETDIPAWQRAGAGAAQGALTGWLYGSGGKKNSPVPPSPWPDVDY